MVGEILTNPCVPGRRFQVVPAVTGRLCVMHGTTEYSLVAWAKESNPTPDWFATNIIAGYYAKWMLVEVPKPRPVVGDTLRLTDALDHPGLVVYLVGSDSWGWFIEQDRKMGNVRLPRDTRSPTGKTLEQWVEVTGDRGPPTPPIDLTPLRDCWTNLTRSWGQALAIHHHSASWNTRLTWERRRGQWFRHLVHTPDYWRLMSLNGWRPDGTAADIGMSMTVNVVLDALIAADRAEAGGK